MVPELAAYARIAVNPRQKKTWCFDLLCGAAFVMCALLARPALIGLQVALKMQCRYGLGRDPLRWPWDK
jgi:hypothetical protein